MDDLFPSIKCIKSGSRRSIPLYGWEAVLFPRRHALVVKTHAAYRNNFPCNNDRTASVELQNETARGYYWLVCTHYMARIARIQNKEKMTHWEHMQHNSVFRPQTVSCKGSIHPIAFTLSHPLRRVTNSRDNSSTLSCSSIMKGKNNLETNKSVTNKSRPRDVWRDRRYLRGKVLQQ